MDRITKRIVNLERLFEDLFICSHSRRLVVFTLSPPTEDPG